MCKNATTPESLDLPQCKSEDAFTQSSDTSTGRTKLAKKQESADEFQKIYNNMQKQPEEALEEEAPLALSKHHVLEKNLWPNMEENPTSNFLVPPSQEKLTQENIFTLVSDNSSKKKKGIQTLEKTPLNPLSHLDNSKITIPLTSNTIDKSLSSKVQATLETIAKHIKCLSSPNKMELSVVLKYPPELENATMQLNLNTNAWEKIQISFFNLSDNAYRMLEQHKGVLLESLHKKSYPMHIESFEFHKKRSKASQSQNKQKKIKEKLKAGFISKASHASDS